MTDTNKSTCPKCNETIPGDAPAGLCPQCVLAGAAFASQTIPTSGRNTPPPSVAEIAPHFPELEILELLGAGGMGAVYKVRQPKLDRIVALKILSHDLASDPAFAERFNREARVLARLSHPNIVGIFDFGMAGPLCYLTMEYVDGVNLRQAMQAGRFTPSESLAMVEDICAALKFAHEEGILHRDIKPENVLIDSKGRVKIADFGIAKLIGEGERSDITLTMQGSILGSPHYMAPEQIETPGDVDQRADIYSLGVVFYELLTGELPIGRFALPSEKATMDTRIDEIVMRTLEKERQARFQSADEVMTQVGVVSQSPEAARSAKAPVQSDDPGPAGFSLVAAIFTGLSLVGVIASLWIGNDSRGLGLSRETGRVLMMVILVLSAMMAISGFIFGSVALGAIRKSGGEKGGLGSSVFAVVLWPILLLGVIGSFFLKIPKPMLGNGGQVSVMALTVCLVGSQILAGCILVRGVRRWALGVISKSGVKRFPGLGRTVFASVGVVILGVMFLEVAATFFPTSDRSDHFDEMERERARSESEYRAIISGGVDWYRGAPEVVFPFEVHPGMRAELRLVRKDASGDLKYAEIGLVDRVQGNVATKTQVKIGTSGPHGEAFEGERGFSALLLYGWDTSGTIFGASDFAGWDFEANHPDVPSFDKPGLFEFRIAQRQNEKEELTESLHLEVIVTEE